MVVAAHPDDEVLGLGGTINQIVATQQGVARAVILGEGITSRSDARDPIKWKHELAAHKENIHLAGKCIGFESWGIYDFPDNRFDSVALLDIIKVLEKEIEQFRPDIIFTHHPGDLNIDHRVSTDALLAATRPLPGVAARTIISYETPSSTEWNFSSAAPIFTPNMFIVLKNEEIQAKLKAMECYKSECRDYPHPRSLRALEIIARRWGTVVGSEYAEAFQILNCVIRPGV
jgi:LmbE family N-acetylglucosaminyl deacetylase